MARIIGEVRPRYAFVENSPMLTSRGLGTVLRDLAEMGYDAEWGVLSAADVGANHQRDRIWIVAKQRDILSYTEHNRDGWGEQQSESTQKTDGKMADSNNNGHNYKKSRELFANTEQTETREEFNKTSRHNSLANSIEFGIQSELSSKRKTSKWINSHGYAKGKELANTSSENVERHELPSRTSEGFFAFGSHSWWSIEPNLDRVAHGMASRVDRLKAIGNGQVPLCAATAWSILMERINGL
jgi:DNA (cytosine-5)-methyltransferase 1